MQNIHKLSLAAVIACFSMPAQAQQKQDYNILDMTITQNGEKVTINGSPIGWSLSFSIDIGPRPLSISLPLAGCDLANEATYVRAYNDALAPDLGGKLLMVIASARLEDKIEMTFPPGFGFAAEPGVQRVLYAEDPASPRLDQGFNAFFGERYARVTDKTVTLTIDRVEGPGWDPLTAGVPFILMVGRAGCSEYPDMPVALIAVNFG